MNTRRVITTAFRNSISTILFFLLILQGCTCEKKDDGTTKQTVSREIPLWLKQSSIARIELAQPSDGKLFNRVEKKIPELQNAGFTAVWFSTIAPTSSLYRQAEPTDPVPAQDFLNVDKDFGSLDDFRMLVQALHTAGLKVIIELAPKYTAWDSKLVQEHPDWFRTNDEGAIVAPNNEWSDVADLNYEHHELRKYMVGVLMFWAQDIGVDGFAFQKADLVPLDFWTRARTEIARVKQLAFLAQSNLPEHHVEAFDATYSNDGGVPGFERGEVPSALPHMLEDEAAGFPQGYVRMRFNAVIHDYPQVDSTIQKNPLEKVHTALAYTIPGVPVTVLDTRWVDSRNTSQSSFLQFVSQLTRLRKDYSGIVEAGITERKLAEQTTFIAYERKLQNARLLVLLNYANGPQNILLQLPVNFQGGFGDYLSSSMLTPVEHKLEFSIKPYDIKILTRMTEATQQ